MKRILLMDDDKDLAFLTKSVLNQAGYMVSVGNQINEGKEALNLHHIDLFLMDILMPGVNGGDIIKEFKKEPLYKETPVIFLSGLIDKKERMDAEFIIVDGQKYQAIAKPYEVEDLINVVKKHLRVYDK